MSDIYSMIKDAENNTTPPTQQLPTATTGGPNSSAHSYEEKVYKAVAFDVDTCTRDTNTFSVFSQQEIPEDVKQFIDETFVSLARKKYIMRTEADEKNTLEDYLMPTYLYKEIYLPWAKFNALVTATLKYPSELAYRTAVWYQLNSRKNQTEDRFNKLPNVVKAFLARSMHITLGKDLKDISKFIVVYSKCGTTGYGKDMDFEALGRLTNVFSISKLFGIKVYNLGDEESRKEFTMFIDKVVNAPAPIANVAETEQ